MGGGGGVWASLGPSHRALSGRCLARPSVSRFAVLPCVLCAAASGRELEDFSGHGVGSGMGASSFASASASAVANAGGAVAVPELKMPEIQIPTIDISQVPWQPAQPPGLWAGAW